jgi:uncharacterized protein with HEPN domain
MRKGGYRVYLEDILSSISKIQSYIGDSSYDEFIKDEMKLDAVVRNLEIIGEASRHIPAEIKGNYSDIEWRKIGAFRNILAHEYFGIDYEILWDIITSKLNSLHFGIQSILNKEE